MLTIDEIFKSRGYNVPTFVLDAEGKEVKIETRDDEEQRIKYQRIVDSLIGAGYYRAIIKQISPFDVIVGGMTWCIDSSDIDLDVDLLFKDSLTTGQKISLTEKIVVVLPKIKCPHFIEPHQIQGLDFIHIFPVIQWLIQWSDENRKRKQDFLLSYALNQYHKRFTDPDTISLRKIKEKRAERIHAVTAKYLPVRVAKQSDDSIEKLIVRVEGTLAEYGLSTLQQDSGLTVGLHATRPIKKSEFDLLFRGLISSDLDKDQLNFEKLDKFEQLFIKEGGNKAEKLKTEISNLQREKEALENSLKKCYEKESELEKKIECKNVDVENLKEEEKKVLEEIHELVILHEKLKEEERKFKEFCKLDLTEIESEIEEMEAHQGDDDIEELKSQLEDLYAKLEVKKQELGKKTRTVSAKERIVDQIPSHSELSQYQKRFLELYKQVGLKHIETKRYFIMFNTVSEKFVYMEREFNILNSIQDNYTQAITSGENKDDFLIQLKSIVSGIQNAKKKITDKRNEKKRNKDELNDRLISLQNKKREYISTAKQFADEYKRLEQISANLKNLMDEKNSSK